MKPTKTIEVTRTYLQMTTPSELHPARVDDAALRLARAENCPPSFYRYLYGEVGRRYHWIDRSDWTEEQLRAHLARPSVQIWVLYYEDSPAGYFELEQHRDGSIEIAYFGLLGQFIGRGIGKHMLTCAVETAWGNGATRVWLHTCTLDDPAALPNYLKRGFKSIKQESYLTDV